MKNDLSSCWWPTTSEATSGQPAPLAALETAVDCLRDGVAVPKPHASLLLDALLRFMAGSNFEQALGMQRSQIGKPTQVQIAAQDWRDSKIRQLAQLVPGECCKARAQEVVNLLNRQEPTGNRYVQDAELIADELRLRQRYGLELPTSLRQMQRIIGGR